MKFGVKFGIKINGKVRNLNMIKILFEKRRIP